MLKVLRHDWDCFGLLRKKKHKKNYIYNFTSKPHSLASCDLVSEKSNRETDEKAIYFNQKLFTIFKSICAKDLSRSRLAVPWIEQVLKSACKPELLYYIRITNELTKSQHFHFYLTWLMTEIWMLSAFAHGAEV